MSREPVPLDKYRVSYSTDFVKYFFGFFYLFLIFSVSLPNGVAGGGGVKWLYGVAGGGGVKWIYGEAGGSSLPSFPGTHGSVYI